MQAVALANIPLYTLQDYMAIRLLVIDDEQLVRDTLRLMLHFDGHEVQTASGAAEALALFRPGRFDLVITDCSMPGMDGAQLAAAIEERDPKQRVLMVTAHVEAHAGPPKGVDLMLGKPFALDALRRAIAQVLPPASQ
jgi:CheY-like chemotaxis protein